MGGGGRPQVYLCITIDLPQASWMALSLEDNSHERSRTGYIQWLETHILRPRYELLCHWGPNNSGIVEYQKYLFCLHTALVYIQLYMYTVLTFLKCHQCLLDLVMFPYIVPYKSGASIHPQEKHGSGINNVHVIILIQ